MGCYDYTLNFLSEIGAQDNYILQDSLEITFLNKHKEVFPLRSRGKLFPINLLLALLNYKALSFAERIKIVSLFAKLILIDTKDYRDISLKQWFEREGISLNSIKSFLEIISVGTLNAGMEKATAGVFIRVLKEIFLKSNKASSLIIPKDGLSEMYCHNAERYLNEMNCEIKFSERVTCIEKGNGKINKVITNKSVYEDFDFVVSAIPQHSLNKLLPEYNLINSIEYSPILTLHIWLKENRLQNDFYGFIDADVHWVFNKGKHITTVTSAADKFVGEKHEVIFQHICEIIEKYLNEFSKEDVIDYKVILDRRATFIPSVSTEKQRERITSPIENLELAGDWVNTELPATIEGAVKSGFLSAERISRA